MPYCNSRPNCSLTFCCIKDYDDDDDDDDDDSVLIMEFV